MKVSEIVTEKILKMLEAGVAPWARPWQANGIHMRYSGKPYRGINQLLLSLTTHETPIWITYRAAAALGGNVKRGEKGMPCVYWNFPTAEESAAGKRAYPRYSTIFNIGQCENVPTPKWYTRATVNIFSPIETAAAIVRGMPNCPKINHGGDSAYYRPSNDSVNMPSAESFYKPESYYATLFHELAHSTASDKRIGRPITADSMRAESYGKEELIAELCSAILCNESRIDSGSVTAASASYLACWIKTLRGDSSLIMAASSAAQRAADFILDHKPELESESEAESESVAA